jgi:hypothetical protein
MRRSIGVTLPVVCAVGRPERASVTGSERRHRRLSTPSQGWSTATLAGVSRLQLAPVAQDLTDFEAKVVTARLGADGIIWQLRGVMDGMYPLGGIDVLVPVDELEEARASLRGEAGIRTDAHVQAPAAEAGLDEPDWAPPPAGRGRRRWVTLVVVAGLAVFSATRVVAAVVSFQQPVTDDCSGSLQAAAEGFTRPCRR